MRALVTAVALTVIAALGGTALVALPPAQADPAVIHYVYDDLDRLVGVVDQHGNVATYAYDAVGNLRRIERVDAAAAPGVVAITLVTPTQGVADTVVRIFGKGFAASLGQNTVRFNGTLAMVTSAAPNHLVTRVPAGAMTGPITVQTPLGSAASPAPFRVIGVLAITPPGGVLLVQTSRQFTATDSGNPDTTFSWSVNEIAGGNAAVGTVTPAGVYTAPASVPTPSGVTLTATATDTRATVSVPILIASEPHFALEVSSPVSVGVVVPSVTAPVPATADAAPVAVAVTVEPTPPAPTPASGFAHPVAVAVASPAVGPEPVPAVGVASPVSLQLSSPATGPEPTPAVKVAPPVGVQVSSATDTPPATPALTVVRPVAVETQAAPTSADAAVAHLHGVVALSLGPVITSVTPMSAPPGTTNLVVTLTGAGLAGATAVTFLRADGPDGAITVAAASAEADGTRASVTISVAGQAAPGPRVVQITTPTGSPAEPTRASTPVAIGGNVFTVQ